jgi:anti-sigma B factor antagonist
MEFQIEKYPEEQVVCIRVPGRLTQENADELMSLLKQFTESGEVQLVLDMSTTERIDSSGIGAIVSQIASLRSKQGDVRLAEVQPFVQEVLKVTHLDKILKIFPTCQEAIKSYGLKL